METQAQGGEPTIQTYTTGQEEFRQGLCVQVLTDSQHYTSLVSEEATGTQLTSINTFHQVDPGDGK